LVSQAVFSPKGVIVQKGGLLLLLWGRIKQILEQLLIEIFLLLLILVVLLLFLVLMMMMLTLGITTLAGLAP